MTKKVTAKTVQITKPESVKCRASKEFKANMITFTKPNSPRPPRIPKWFSPAMKIALAPIHATLREHTKRMDKH
ncbi:hypothetical protein FACS1894166_05050 [Bacilli bacterium]|nr:hypothetical protein FACS1894166_05050 [Bacilli bacterium]